MITAQDLLDDMLRCAGAPRKQKMEETFSEHRLREDESKQKILVNGEGAANSSAEGQSK